MKRGTAFYALPESIRKVDCERVLSLTPVKVCPLSFFNAFTNNLNFNESNGVFYDNTMFLRYFERNYQGVYESCVNLGSFIEEISHYVIDQGKPQVFSELLRDWHSRLTDHCPRFVGNEYKWYHVAMFDVMLELNKNEASSLFRKLRDFYLCVLYNKFYEAAYPWKAIGITKEEGFKVAKEPIPYPYPKFYSHLSRSYEDLSSIITRNSLIRFDLIKAF